MGTSERAGNVNPGSRAGGLSPAFEELAGDQEMDVSLLVREGRARFLKRTSAPPPTLVPRSLGPALAWRSCWAAGGPARPGRLRPPRRRCRGGSARCSAPSRRPVCRHGIFPGPVKMSKNTNLETS